MPSSGIHFKGEKNFSEIYEDFKNQLKKEVGAVGSFVGLVREEGKKGSEVEKIHYECAEDAENDLENIAMKIEEEVDGISEVAIHHIIDDLEPGDEIIYVLAAGRHRKEVFEALPRIMDKVKTEVKIWKKEITKNDEYWMHEVDE